MTVAQKDDRQKPRTDLIPTEPLFGAAEVFAFGAEKYGIRNWELGLEFGRLYAAALRHMFDWWSGEELDQESQYHHLSHAMCCLMMLHATVNRSGANSYLDDRKITESP